MEMYNLQQAFKQSDGAADIFQEAFGSEEKRLVRENLIMNSALEDRMCDLYDLYIQVFNTTVPNSCMLYSICTFYSSCSMLLILLTHV